MICDARGLRNSGAQEVKKFTVTGDITRLHQLRMYRLLIARSGGAPQPLTDAVGSRLESTPTHLQPVRASLQLTSSVHPHHGEMRFSPDRARP